MNIKDLKSVLNMISLINMYGGLRTGEAVVLAELVSQLPANSKIVEVGSLAGRSSCALCFYAKHMQVYCVDAWDVKYIKDLVLKEIFSNIDVLKVFKNNMAKNGFTPVALRLTSVEASKRFKDNSIDLIFIDADHAYESIREDIQSWLPKVKKGGIICGHDYSGQEKGVIKAVDELLGKNKIETILSIWIHRKE